MQKLTLFAPLSGILLPIESVPDQVFAQKMVGEGVGIDPTDNILKAPCDGRVVQLHKSLHAITIEMENKNQILLHIGLDTVNLKGEGFKTFVKLGDRVHQGQDLIEFDQDLIALKGLSLISVMVMIAGATSSKFQYQLTTESYLKSGETSLIELEFPDKNLNEKEVISNLENGKNAYSIPFFIRLPSGMHARPAAKLAEASKNFRAQIEIRKQGKRASLSSIISVLGLEIAKDDEIMICAVGDDSEQAINAIQSLLLQIEEEEILNYQSTQAPSSAQKKIVTVESNERTLVGVSASDGIVIGKVAFIHQEKFSYQEMASDHDCERTKLEEAISEASQELSKIELGLSANPDDASKSAIFAAHRGMLQDLELQEDCVRLINQGKSAAYSWDQTIIQRVTRLQSLKNELIAGRANDLKDIGHRVLRNILGIKEVQKVHQEKVILIANDLTPSDTVQLDQSKVLGFCTTSGGATSHVAILARSMGIPAIAGIESRALELGEGLEVLLDGDLGALFLNPTEEEKQQVYDRQKSLDRKKKLALENSHLEAQTADGVRVEVVANISGLTDAQKAVEMGAEGVGLLRTEFLFLDREFAPSEKEQFEIYQSIADALGDKPLVIRTLDVGGDKALKYLPIAPEENPFLGIRGIRLSLKNEQMFREQLRAILKVKSSAQIHIMFPMVGQLIELKEAKRILEEERKNLNAPEVKVGIMIEVPSAAVLAEQFAPEVDFFSIGTNDLTQYTMAMDRGHNELAKQVDGLHPAVLSLIEMTVKAAHKSNKWVGICGGIASDSKAIPILIGLGVDELSLSIPNIPMIKVLIRLLNHGECVEMAQKALQSFSGEAVRELVINQWPQI